MTIGLFVTGSMVNPEMTIGLYINSSLGLARPYVRFLCKTNQNPRRHEGFSPS
jgi:hypothetical protein